MADKIFMKQNDLKPYLVLKLLDGDVVADLTTALAVRFLMRSPDGSLKVNAPMTVTDAVEGLVTYVWQLGDTNTLSNYKAEVEVMWPGSKPQTFPNNTYFVVAVIDDLDA